VDGGNLQYGMLNLDNSWNSKTLQRTAAHCNILQHIPHYSATHYTQSDDVGNPQHAMLSFDDSRNGKTLIILQHNATHCNTLQHTATHCNALQRTALHCNTLHAVR